MVTVEEIEENLKHQIKQIEDSNNKDDPYYLGLYRAYKNILSLIEE